MSGILFIDLLLFPCSPPPSCPLSPLHLPIFDIFVCISEERRRSIAKTKTTYNTQLCCFQILNPTPPLQHSARSPTQKYNLHNTLPASLHLLLSGHALPHQPPPANSQPTHPSHQPIHLCPHCPHDSAPASSPHSSTPTIDVRSGL